jgi:hypothetical protein
MGSREKGSLRCPAGPEPFWFRAGGAWALGIGLDLTSHSPRCFRMAWMISRSSMKLIYVELHINQLM